eukprot:COSAG02_NODE_7190_length_3128_cov_1.814130_4_plen_71_part_00
MPLRDTTPSQRETVPTINALIYVEHRATDQRAYFRELGRARRECRKALDVRHSHRLRDVELQCLHNHWLC